MSNTFTSNGTASPMVKLTPSNVLVFTGKLGRVGSVALTIKNCEMRAIYFKVKSNSLRFYSIQPDNGIIEPQKHMKLVIQLNDDNLAKLEEIETERHKFLIMAAFCSNSTVQANEFWKDKNQGSEGVFVKKLKTKVKRALKQPKVATEESKQSNPPIKAKLSKMGKQIMEVNHQVPEQNQKEASPMPGSVSGPNQKEAPPIPEHTPGQNQREVSSVHDDMSDLEPSVSKTIAESVPEKDHPKADTIRPHSSANRLYAKYTAEMISSLLEKMSTKDAFEFRKELNNFLEKRETGLL